MEITPNLAVMASSFLVKLTEILATDNYHWWPRDVVQAVERHNTVIQEIMGFERTPGLDDYLEIRDLGARTLEQIWSLLPCPWCGNQNDHRDVCPMLTGALDFESIMTAWESGLFDSRMYPRHPQPWDQKFGELNQYYELGWERGQALAPMQRSR